MSDSAAQGSSEPVESQQRLAETSDGLGQQKPLSRQELVDALPAALHRLPLNSQRATPSAASSMDSSTLFYRETLRSVKYRTCDGVPK